MSEWSVRVVKIGKIGKHPNADTLSITTIDSGYPCIIRTGDFNEGDLAVYVPVDSVVPDTEEFAFLNGHRRIEAKRLRGIFSMGLLRPVQEGMAEGDDVSVKLDITKWLPAMPKFLAGDNERGPTNFNFIVPPELHPVRKYTRKLEELSDIEFVITEKIHGAQGRYTHDGDRLWVGSHRCVKKEGGSIWWQIAQRFGLAEKLARAPRMIFMGEVYGNVQDLKYGLPNGAEFRVFDVFDSLEGRWLNFDAAKYLAEDIGLQWVPVLYRGKWDSSRIAEWGEGHSTIPNANCIREGFVAKPTIEQFDYRLGRLGFKYPGEAYLTRKNKADFVDGEDTEASEQASVD